MTYFPGDRSGAPTRSAPGRFCACCIAP
jgi:hypothetical protein